MQTRRLRRFLKAGILLTLAVFVLGAISASQRPFLVPAAAKGMMKTKSSEDSSDSQSARSENKDESKKEETKRDETTSKSDSSRENSSTSRSEDSAVLRTNESRDQTSDSTVYKPGQVRDEGTPDVRGTRLPLSEALRGYLLPSV
jgi:cytoskeletal protein RodZ